MIHVEKALAFARAFLRRLRGKLRAFPGSARYWEERYAAGGDSGPGSRNRLARFKAEFVNNFVAQNAVSTIIEYGCGDGSQLSLADYPQYLGFDVSPRAVELCRERFLGDSDKRFKLVSDYAGERAELTLSLDVIYHLVEDDVFHSYMARLLDSSDRFVIVYASDVEPTTPTAPHVRHRRFTRWIAEHRSEWHLCARIPNRYPFDGDLATTSFSDFFVFRRDHTPAP
jgi:SAM-dependent methyltransferase